MVRRAVDAATYDRARTWAATFGIEQIAAAVLSGESDAAIDGYVDRAVAWLQRTSLSE